MSGFNTPLTAGQYTLLRSGSYAGDWLLTLCKNTVVLKGQLTIATTALASWAFVNYTTISGSYLDVEPNMAVVFSTVDDIKTAQPHRGRVRLDYAFGQCATATTLYVGESSADWPIGTYFWVLYTFDLMPRLSSFDLNQVESIDFNWPYQADPAVAPTLRMAYVGDCDPATEKMRIAFNVSDAYASALNASVTGYQWTFKAGTATVISGSLSSAIVTVDLVAGEQWGKLRLTDSNGTTWDRRFYIQAHDADNPYDTGFERLTINGNLSNGWTLQAPGFTGIDDVLSNTFGVISIGTELFGGTATHLDTNNIIFVGWVQAENGNLTPDATASLLSDDTLTLSSITARLARMAAQNIGISSHLIASGVWGYNAGPTMWRAMIHYLAYYTTALFLCGIDFRELDNAFAYPDIAITGMNALDAIQNLAKPINAALAAAGDGRLRVDRDAGHLSQAQRNALPVVANYTAADCLPVNRTNDLGTYGLVDASGNVWNPTSSAVTPFSVRAPGLAMGETQGKGSLPGQVLAATSDANAARQELIQRANDEIEMLNTSEVLSVRFTDGHHYLIPSRSQLFTFTLDAPLGGVARIVYDTSIYWLCESVSYTLPGNGAIDVQASFRRLSPIGDSTGLDMTPPDTPIDPPVDPGPNAFPWEPPDLPGPDTPPPPLPVGSSIFMNGQELLAHSASKIYFIRNLISGGTHQRNTLITPSDLGAYTPRAVAVDPALTRRSVPSYVLASDGTHSAVWKTANALAPVWSAGASLTGTGMVMRATGSHLGVAYLSDTGAWSYTIDLRTGLHGCIIDVGSRDGSGGHTGFFTSEGRGYRTLTITIPYALHVTSVTCDYDTVAGIQYDLPVDDYWYPDGNDAPGNRWINRHIATGTNRSLSASPDVDVTEVTLNLSSGYDKDGGDPGGEVTLRTITIDGTGPNPWGSTNSLTVVFSGDGGATWGTPRVIGDSVDGRGGFDVQRSGAVSFAGCDSKVRVATTLGGAYADHTAYPGAVPVCVVIPYTRWGTTTQRNTAVINPDYLVALDMADSGGGTLYKVNGITGAKTDITPVAGITFVGANCATTRYGTQLIVYGRYGTAWRAYRSTNAGSSWTLIGPTPTAPTAVRCRRNESSVGANRGQVFLANASIYYSPNWGSAALVQRAMPDTIIGFDTVY